MMRICVNSGRAFISSKWVVGLGVISGLILGFSSHAATSTVYQNATLAWDALNDPSVAGYYLYYGNASGNYSTRIDVGTNTSGTVSNLVGGSTYYFTATAYNTARVESTPSSEATFMASTNPAPNLTPISLQFVNPMEPFYLTNSINTLATLGRKFTYSLDAGAPAGMRINRNSGVITWVPPFSAAGNSYDVAVHVTDNMNPPATSAQTFTVVVNNAVILNPGLGAVAAGQTVSIPLVANVSTLVTNLTFTLDVPSAQFSSAQVQAVSSLPATITQSPVGGTHSTVTIVPSGGQAIQGTETVANLVLTARPGAASAFAGVQCSNIVAQVSSATSAPKTTANAGRLVVVGLQSLLEARVRTNGVRDLVLYSTNSTYQIQYTTNCKNTNSWTALYSGSVTNLTQVFQNVATTNPMVFFRAWTK